MIILFSVYSSPVHTGASEQAARPGNAEQLAVLAAGITNGLVPAGPFHKFPKGAASVSSHLAGGSSIVSHALTGGLHYKRGAQGQCHPVTVVAACWQ